MSPAKKISPKKVPNKPMSIIKYADKRLIPPAGFIAHPVYMNSPDSRIILPKGFFTITTGLEVSIPPIKSILFVNELEGVVPIRSHFFGYQEELTIEYNNLMNMNIELEAYERIGSMYILQMSDWT